jgi:putative DNA primase/helicase
MMIMSEIVNQSIELLQGQSEEVEQFVLFMVSCSLGKGIKSRIKSHDCCWNSLFHGWLCPLAKQKEVQSIIQEAKVGFETRVVALAKGVIAADPKIADRQCRLEILEEEAYKEDRQLLTDIYRYNDSLRPEDFDQPQDEEEKTSTQIQVERDFHLRRVDLKKKREEIEQARKELSHLSIGLDENVLDHDAPLLIADSLIKQHFLYKKQRTLQYCSDVFWRWSGIQYVQMEDEEVRQIIYTFLRDAKKLNGSGHLERFNPNKFKVDQVVDALRGICYQRHHLASGAVWLDGREKPDPQYLISFSNGLLSIEDWLKDSNTSLISHTPLLLNVNSLTFDFDPNASEPKEWLQFLNTIWPEDLEAPQVLQEWIGYILTQDTRQHKILLIVGPPRSGKGTIGRILRELLGQFNVAAPTLSNLGGEFGLQPLLNKTLALISDARLSGKNGNSVIIERLLSISGEDPLTINRKFLPSLTVQLPTRIMVMSNELPDMRDSSGALAKRYLVLTLKKSWLGNEDISLFCRLKAELPGILLWALQGLARLQKRGYFVQPKSSAQTIEELESMTSPIKAFIAERCEIIPQARVAVVMLFEEWRSWCAMTGYPQSGNVQSFGKNLRAAFPDIEISRPQESQSRERCYKGIRIASFSNPSADVHGL